MTVVRRWLGALVCGLFILPGCGVGIEEGTGAAGDGLGEAGSELRAPENIVCWYPEQLVTYQVNKGCGCNSTMKPPLDLTKRLYEKYAKCCNQFTGVCRGEAYQGFTCVSDLSCLE